MAPIVSVDDVCRLVREISLSSGMRSLCDSGSKQYRFWDGKAKAAARSLSRVVNGERATHAAGLMEAAVKDLSRPCMTA